MNAVRRTRSTAAALGGALLAGALVPWATPTQAAPEPANLNCWVPMFSRDLPYPTTADLTAARVSPDTVGLTLALGAMPGLAPVPLTDAPAHLTVRGTVDGQPMTLTGQHAITVGPNAAIPMPVVTGNVSSSASSLSVTITHVDVVASALGLDVAVNCTPDGGALTRTVTLPGDPPTEEPTATPTTSPTTTPKPSQTPQPSTRPSTSPTSSPTTSPTTSPTKTPTVTPTKTPTVTPTRTPTVTPTKTPAPTVTPTPPVKPTVKPGVKVKPAVRVHARVAKKVAKKKAARLSVGVRGLRGPATGKVRVVVKRGKVVVHRSTLTLRAGQAAVKTKRLKRGSYSVTVSYVGSASYKGSSTKALLRLR